MLGQLDHPEKEIETHSNILAWEIPWTEQLQSMGSQKSWTLLTTKQQQKQYSIVYIYNIFFIRSSVKGHLCCFHVVAIVNIAAMKIACMYIFEPCFSPDICPRVGLQNHMVILFLVF